MILFSHLISILVTGIAATLIGQFVAAELAALIRRAVTWRDPGLGWSPSQSLDASGFQSDRRIPDLNASDWPARGLDL